MSIAGINPSINRPQPGGAVPGSRRSAELEFRPLPRHAAYTTPLTEVPDSRKVPSRPVLNRIQRDYLAMIESFSLAVHGGAGVIHRAAMTPELDAAHRAGLHTALLAGHRVLVAGGTAVDAITQAVIALEDDPQFNAGCGAVFTSAGQLEMDAAIMDGRDRSAGAVAGILGPRNPVLAARAVMERSSNVLLMGQGALSFCRDQNLVFEDAAYFHTDIRWQALQSELERRRLNAPDNRDDADRHGTVGAVARDAAGNLAAATSSGGMTAKRPGRVGDCPIFGAGTWAENGTCAVSATGHGEIFIRHGVAHEIAARMRLGGQTLVRAAADVVAELQAAGGKAGLVDVVAELRAGGGNGGLIAIDSVGEIVMPFNCEGMYRGTIGLSGIPRTGIYGEELQAG